jgi:hypothetical protein
MSAGRISTSYPDVPSIGIAFLLTVQSTFCLAVLYHGKLVVVKDIIELLVSTDFARFDNTLRMWYFWLKVIKHPLYCTAPK